MASDWPPAFGDSDVNTSEPFPVSVVAMIVLGVAATLFAVAWWIRRVPPRQRALTELLDAADALESRLRTARSEIEAITGNEDEAVRTALQEMLRQRLWLQQHGETASIQQLKEIRGSMDAARAKIDQQLIQVERARATAH